MKTQHLFFASSAELVTDRWREAFAGGRICDPPEAHSSLRDLKAGECVIWLSSGDPQWPTHLSKVLQVLPGARTILLSTAPTQPEGLGALEAGVRGYAHAYGVPAMLQEVATVVEHGGLWVGSELLRRLVGSTTSALVSRTASAAVGAPVVRPGGPVSVTLSGREEQVARAVCAGRSNKEVADLMFISERTVKAHLSSIFEKLGVRDRLQLALRMAPTQQEEPP